MTTFTVSNASITFSGEAREGIVGGKAATSEIANLVTTDGLKAEISVQKFAEGDIHIRLSEFLATPPPLYAHLINNGTMTVQVREDGKWVALVRALRPGGRDHPTLNSISWDELDFLFGENARDWLINLGFEVGIWSEINPKAGKFKDSIALAIDADKGHLLVLPWALTRVIALMKQLGNSTVGLV